MSSEPPKPEGEERSRRTTARRFSLSTTVAAFRKVDTHSPNSYPDNNVSTTKYTMANFFPKNMMEQFSRMANVYFLIISVLTSLPISPKDPISLVGTFVLVLMFSAAKEAYEDVQRHKSDEETNTQKCSVLKSGNLVSVDWRDVKCGDVLCISKDEPFPADVIVLSTSDDEHGLCFIDTCNIDGETNLKTMNAIEYTKKTTALPELSKLNLSIECENPNPSLYTFSGSMSVTGNPEKLSVGVSNVLLRGCILRQTKAVYGVAIFTGHDTKLMKNAAGAPFKVSYLMKMMNQCLTIVFAFQALICMINTIFAKSFKNDTGQYMMYTSNRYLLEEWNRTEEEGYNFNSDLELGIGFEAESFLTFVVAYANLVPISLYVALEIVKLFQVVLIDNDIEIYHAESNTATVARTSNLVEELGQVRFIFSDKTGTLTCNVMEFACCSIGGRKFHTVGSYENSAFLDESVYKSMAPDKGGDVDMYATQTMFWKLLSVCHNVLPEYPEDDDGNLAKVKYQASSPDEAALVMAAKEIGYQFAKGTPVLYHINNTTTGEKEAWKILATIEFNSTRKRMSIIAETPEGKKLLFTKGADNIIIERLDPNGKHLSPLKQTQEHLGDYAEIGLRTLCLAYKEISDDEYDKFNKDWSAALLSIHAREEMQDAISEEFEKNLILVGATAIEDKLQDGVPEAIETLADAGIKLWVLTGDKQETAINIGFSCKLLTHDMHIHILSGSSTVAELKQHLMELMMNDVKTNEDARHAIVIDGATLTLALNEEVRMEFLQFGLLCDVCICCRVSPKQKAEVVKLVKDNLTNPPVITLAIGDGANDVSMIQAAHIGVGISGQEGMQAVRASDFSIAQFRFLTRLLVVHGSWAYKRVAKFILFYFYKNMANVLTEYFFAFWTGFSGQILFADWLSIGYNAAYSSFGCIFGFCLDQDVNKASIQQYPRLYEFSMFGQGFDMLAFAVWMGVALWHGAVCYFIPYGFMYSAVEETGQVFGHWFHGTTSFVCLLLIVHFKMSLMIYSWNYMVKAAIVVSIAIFFVTFVILCTYWFSTTMRLQEEMLGFVGLLFTSRRFYFCTILTSITAIIPDFAFKYYTTMYLPEPHNILHENEMGWSEGVYKKPANNKTVAPMDA